MKCRKVRSAYDVDVRKDNTTFPLKVAMSFLDLLATASHKQAKVGENMYKKEMSRCLRL